MANHRVREIVLGVLAIVSIVFVVVDSLADLSRGVLMTLYIIDLLICIIFAIDFIQRLTAAKKKRSFLKSNWFEILALVPAIALYALGTVSAIAVVLRSLRLVRVVMVLARMRRLFAESGRFFQKSSLLALAGITLAIIFMGAFAAYVFDIGTPGSEIRNFSDAVWWSISTVTTVGYGDIVPESVAGRIMGMVLMVIGIGVMTAFISQVSATMVESRLKKARRNDLRSSLISEIKEKLDDIEKMSEKDFTLLMHMLQGLKTGEVVNSLESAPSPEALSPGGEGTQG